MKIYDANGEEIPTPDRKPAIGFGAHLYDTRGAMKQDEKPQLKPEVKDGSR